MRALVIGVGAASVAALALACVACLVLMRESSPRRRLSCLACPVSQLTVAAFSLGLFSAGVMGALFAGLIAACSLVCSVLDVVFFRALMAAESAGLAHQEAVAAREQYEAQLAHARRVSETRDSLEGMLSDAVRTFGLTADELAAGNAEAAAHLLGAEERSLESGHDAPCDHVVGAALLSLYERRCAELDVGWSCEARIPRDLPLPPIEVGMLLSNLLSNAVDAARESGAGWPVVRVRASVAHGFLALCVENSCAPDARVPARRRNDALSEHGWGRQIVATIARAHDGEVHDRVADGTWRTDVLVGLDGLEG